MNIKEFTQNINKLLRDNNIYSINSKYNKKDENLILEHDVPDNVVSILTKYKQENNINNDNDIQMDDVYNYILRNIQNR
jgi:hypothetical protein